MHHAKYIFVNHPLLLMGLVGMPPYDAPVRRLERALPTLKPIHNGDDGLWGQAVSRQLDASIVVGKWELPELLGYAT